MNRFHVHLNVADLPASIRFYTALFAVEPTVLKADYAKWMLDDPRINFAISTMGQVARIDHLGVQTDTAEELALLGRHLDAAGSTILSEEATICCYAHSDKLWTKDPQGLRWEMFHTTADAPTYYAAGVACVSETTPQAAAPTSKTIVSCGTAQHRCC